MLALSFNPNELSSKSILIVENEIIIADDIARLTEQLGHRPLTPALNFEQAKLLFIKHSPDLIILDIRLSGTFTGIDFAQWLRQKENTPIIYLSVYNDLLTLKKCQQTKPIAYLNKPFVDNELKIAIESINEP